MGDHIEKVRFLHLGLRFVRDGIGRLLTVGAKMRGHRCGEKDGDEHRRCEGDENPRGIKMVGLCGETEKPVMTDYSGAFEEHDRREQQHRETGGDITRFFRKQNRCEYDMEEIVKEEWVRDTAAEMEDEGEDDHVHRVLDAEERGQSACSAGKPRGDVENSVPVKDSVYDIHTKKNEYEAPQPRIVDAGDMKHEF